MARLLFFVFAAALCLAACFPIRSNYSESGWAEFTLAIGFEDYPSGIYYDRQFDWPTGGAIWLDVPAWAVNAGLLVLCLIAFWFYVKNKLQQQQNV